MSEVVGWNRTFILALGAFLGVIVAAILIHILKGG